MAAWLWPEAAQKQANVNLRQRLFRLRQICGHPLVEASALVRLADGVRCDWPAEAATHDGELLGVVALEDVLEELVGELRDAAHAVSSG